MEVITTRSPDFEFNSTRSSPCSTLRAFGEYYSYSSAPTSPNTMSEFYKDIKEFTSAMKSSNMATVPFLWGENSRVEDEFAFEFSEDAEKASCSAEELFDGGKIKPFKPPTRLRFKEDENTREHAGHERGRGRSAAMGSSSSRRGTRSLSPYRVSTYPWEEEEKQQQQQQDNSKQSSLRSKDSFSSTDSKSSRRWRLRDLLLFRSASEGHATSKDNVKRYSLFFRKYEDVKSDSFRSNESSGSVKRYSRKGKISAHELYYNANKAAQKDLKKKTSLPYKQGIWGRLTFGNGFGRYTH